MKIELMYKEDRSFGLSKMKLYLFLFISFLSVIFFINAEAAVTVNENNLNVESISNDSLNLIRKLKILFGHMSVGADTINGLRDLSSQNKRYRITITQVSSTDDFNSPKLGHFPLGGNKNPVGKLAGFSDKIKNIYGENIQVAIFKLCPLDIDNNTNVNNLFTIYKNTMNDLKASYPNIIFVHVSCPLNAGEDSGNIKRNQFNTLLRNEYDGKDYIFDIAAIESTYPNGRKATFSSGGRTYNKLCREYTRDGIHLNDPSNIGRQRAARGMIYLLAAIAEDIYQ